MANKIHHCRVLVFVSILSGCATPLSTYPVLEKTLETDVSMDCSGFDDEILKANAIRDAIFEEHGDVMEDAVLGSAAEILINPVQGILDGLLRSPSTSKAVKAYIEAASAAGMRMEQLLIYKESDDCQSGPNTDPERTDLQVLNDLRNLQVQLENEEVNSKRYISGRKELLDGLR